MPSIPRSHWEKSISELRYGNGVEASVVIRIKLACWGRIKLEYEYVRLNDAIDAINVERRKLEYARNTLKASVGDSSSDEPE